MAPSLRFGAVVGTLAAAALAASCGLNRVERRLVGPQQAVTLDSASPYLKAHLKNGYLYVLSHWRADTAGAPVVGTRQPFDVKTGAVGNRAGPPALRFVAPFGAERLAPPPPPP